MENRKISVFYLMVGLISALLIVPSFAVAHDAVQNNSHLHLVCDSAVVGTSLSGEPAGKYVILNCSGSQAVCLKAQESNSQLMSKASEDDEEDPFWDEFSY